MSSDSTAAARRRGDSWILPAAILAALLAALLPVARVIESGAWLVGALVLAVLVLTAGHNARRFGLPAVAVSLIEAAVWVVFLTLVFLRDTAFLWVIPTFDTFRAVPPMVESAAEQIALGAAPLEPTASLAFMIIGAMGLLAIIVDHVVVTARMPLLAAVGIVAVSLIPSIAVPRDVDVLGFVFLAVTILFLIRAETRSRERQADQDAERTAGVPATAVGIAAVAIIVAVVATPALPQPAARAGAGIGTGPRIDATLQLGDDLRRPQVSEVLRLRTTSPTVPYLRATTLTRFEGGIWEPDQAQSISLDSDRALGAMAVDDDVLVTEYTTSIEVLNLDSPWAPVPYPAVSVQGLEGRWNAVPYNRTVMTHESSTRGQTYDVVYAQPRPSLEQVRASTASGDQVRDETTELPAELPPIIGELAAQVTASAGNDYDRLALLQRWFRGSEFRYSLDAPVAEGFDGSGAEAVAQFLEVKAGYCIHFASAFALMARTLNIPSRIVIGYLPGEPVSNPTNGEPIYTVSSSQLHAWPEVFFDGIGWISFEPTSGLGSPTTFSTASSLSGEASVQNQATPQATPTPGGPNGADTDDDDERDTSAAAPSATPLDALPLAGVALGVLALLSIPFLVCEVRRRQRDAAARRGDAAAAWQIVQDAAIDVGIAVPSSESPRAFARRLVAEHGVPARDVNVVLIAIERVSYSRAGTRSYWMGDEAAEAAAAVRMALLASVPPARRILALLAPRSLIIRPGSVYAGAAPERSAVRVR